MPHRVTDKPNTLTRLVTGLAGGASAGTAMAIYVPAPWWPAAVAGLLGFALALWVSHRYD